MEILIADSGSTKCEWCYISGGRKQVIETQGASPYFLNESQLIAMMQRELLPPLKGKVPKHIFFYGTGCAAAANRAMVKRAIKKIFPIADIEVEHDLTGAARALCGKKKGIVAILGTKEAVLILEKKCSSTISIKHSTHLFITSSIKNTGWLRLIFSMQFIKNPYPI